MSVQLLIPDDETMLEVAEHAAAANVVMVERRGQIGWVGRHNVPPGWHVVGLTTKSKAPTNTKGIA